MKKTSPTAPLLPSLCYRDDADAARALGVSRQTLWRLCNLPANDPRRIHKTAYRKVPKVELERHLAEEMKTAK